jgi:hypothetical protein
MKQELSLIKMQIKAERILSANRHNGIKKKALFLDFDGVINIYYAPDSEKYKEIEKQSEGNYNFADKECVKRISDLCLQYDLDVVISSSWRYSGLEYCRKYLQNAGMSKAVCIIGTTETDMMRNRAEEIYQYLIAHPQYAGMVVFDDCTMPQLSKVQVITNMIDGVDDKAIACAEEILRKF